jgi:hypothetical protein
MGGDGEKEANKDSKREVEAGENRRVKRAEKEGEGENDSQNGTRRQVGRRGSGGQGQQGGIGWTQDDEERCNGHGRAQERMAKQKWNEERLGRRKQIMSVGHHGEAMGQGRGTGTGWS